MTMSNEKNEWTCEMEIPKKATNIDVGKNLENVFNQLFLSPDVKAIACKILPNEHKIVVKPYKKMKIKQINNFSVVRLNLKDELKHNYLEQYSFMFAETIVDIWNKYMPMEFVLLIDDKDKFKIDIAWDSGMDKAQVQAYWFSNHSDGYNIDAPFWSREWLKEEHKTQSTKGGKR